MTWQYGSPGLSAALRWRPGRLRSWLGAERRKASAGIFDGLNVIIMVVFAIALMDGIPARVIAQPAYALGLAALATGLHIGLNLITVAAFWLTGRQRAYTFGYSHSGRNIAVVMSVLGSAAPDDAWLFFAMLQFPIYCLPMLLRPLYLYLSKGRNCRSEIDVATLTTIQRLPRNAGQTGPY